ncbi:MAG: SAM-dependent methyltransferase [Sphingomonadales bacterium]|nr:SAM-dependent methyltransferase [Sphingomonadales bacterium]
MNNTQNKSQNLAARRATLFALWDVLENEQPMGDAAMHAFKRIELAPRDQAFARNLLITTLRHLSHIDRILKSMMDRPLPGRAKEVKNTLRIGLSQILYLDTPSHAAVDTSVRLVASMKLQKDRAFKGLSNAILRRATREKEALLKSVADIPEAAIPLWMRRKWENDFGENVMKKIAAQTLIAPPLDLTIKDPAEAATWAEKLGGTVVGPQTVRLMERKTVTELEGYASGKWWVQDVAATLPAHILGAKEGELTADLCAAPGGKTMQLAATGAHVVAIDKSAGRLKRVVENLNRTGLEADIVAADLMDYEPDQLFDRILVDAPCSATGTTRRHPEAGYIKKEPVIYKMAKFQTMLMQRVSSWLKPGGVMVYCVCSLEKEESEMQIKRLLEADSSLKRLPVTKDEMGELANTVTADGDVRTLPHYLGEQGGMDGFFIARLQKC